MESFGWLLLGLFVGVIATISVLIYFRFYSFSSRRHRTTIVKLLRKHFYPISLNDIVISERKFPFRVRVDLQVAANKIFETQAITHHFCGVQVEFGHAGLSLGDCLVEGSHNPAISTPPEYEEVDIGDSEPIKVLKIGIWLLEKDGIRLVVLLSPATKFGENVGMQVQIATPNTAAGTLIVSDFFKMLEASVATAGSYRGKILSLEKDEHSYSGEATGITVHKLREVKREQVILPESTLILLERNVIQFVAQRDRLLQYSQATKKGILFYGPPGTGKTHTIHYLTRELAEHTTLLVSAEQVGLLGEYMTLARLLQPSMIVIEDVDLIARDREDMDSACNEVMLNKLLNEMDGLRQDADILFVLTTNRPESLEAALASRPGRIDQAIEFPLPDEVGRTKLIQLYSTGVEFDRDLLADVCQRTQGVSAAFIKELMRRTVQFNIEREGNGQISSEDINQALDEMLVTGGSLNLKLLGATGTSQK